LELGVGRNGIGGLSSVGTPLPMGLDPGDGVLSTSPAMPPIKLNMVYQSHSTISKNAHSQRIKCQIQDSSIKMLFYITFPIISTLIENHLCHCQTRQLTLT
jgi:hypothetical protein